MNAAPTKNTIHVGIAFLQSVAEYLVAFSIRGRGKPSPLLGTRHSVLGTLLLLLFALPTLAQDPPRPITQDDVNDVAERMYCPVCENIPLDDCGTATCVEWKNEIAVMLENGFTSDQIVTDFVNRYGEKVVGVPQDPLLRTLSLVLPAIGLLLASIAAALTVTNWNKSKNTPTETPTVAASDDRYRQQFEQDVK